MQLCLDKSVEGRGIESPHRQTPGIVGIDTDRADLVRQRGKRKMLDLPRIGDGSAQLTVSIDVCLLGGSTAENVVELVEENIPPNGIEALLGVCATEQTRTDQRRALGIERFVFRHTVEVLDLVVVDVGAIVPREHFAVHADARCILGFKEAADGGKGNFNAFLPQCVNVGNRPLGGGASVVGHTEEHHLVTPGMLHAPRSFRHRRTHVLVVDLAVLTDAEGTHRASVLARPGKIGAFDGIVLLLGAAEAIVLHAAL